jgi:GrpB-like predicted nucleotidyltransferase (UPF0157 family)
MELVSYNPDWPAAFEMEADRIATVLGPLAIRIDHNGSTAISGLSAKPIIDIQVSVASLQQLGICGERLGTLGYVHVQHPDDSFCAFFHRPSQWPHSHHVHLVEAGGVEERRTLAFRDYLREHSDVALEYENLKRELAARFELTDPEDHEVYSRAKTDFIERVVEVALRAGYPR